MTTTTSATLRTTASPATAWAVAAAAVGALFAGVSCYWGIGGTWLLDTVGGELEEAGRSGSSAVALLLWATVLAKVVAVVLPLAAVRRAGGPGHRHLRRLAWVEAVVLTGYGAVLTVAGVLVQLGAVATGPDADQRALAWHAFVWDPWFLVWGLLVTAALVRSRPAAGRGTMGP